MENTKGIIFNKEFDELFTDKTKIAPVEIIENAIVQISTLKDVLGNGVVELMLLVVITLIQIHKQLLQQAEV